MTGAAAVWGAAALFAATGSRVAGYADGAPLGFTGGFGEQTCHGCHFQSDLNSGPGGVTIEGVPDSFAPGERYEITVTLSDPAMKLAGFQLTARFKNGGAQAGALIPGPNEDARLGIASQGGLQYANQSRPGSELTTPGKARWTLAWTAPPSAEPVLFHVAANAANGDEAADGDYIYTAAIDAVSRSASR